MQLHRTHSRHTITKVCTARVVYHQALLTSYNLEHILYIILLIIKIQNKGIIVIPASRIHVMSRCVTIHHRQDQRVPDKKPCGDRGNSNIQ